MKNSLLTIPGFLFFILSSAQTGQPSKLSVLTQAEIDRLKPEAGMFVVNSTTSMINYYSAGSWYALGGECLPKPESPTIDTVYEKNNKVLVYFSPVKTGSTYYLNSMMGGKLLEGPTSPLSISKDSLKTGQHYFTVSMSNSCGNSAPSMVRNYLVK